MLFGEDEERNKWLTQIFDMHMEYKTLCFHLFLIQIIIILHLYCIYSWLM